MYIWDQAAFGRTSQNLAQLWHSSRKDIFHGKKQLKLFRFYIDFDPLGIH